ncbi:hypothetical protein QAD02_000494 [Eretmocerus hayati]|uniref:Uncharacterized protein n=1 Tax=Eretmocerus hayati TaxID=131215 RepID=A0ACC2NDJ0_9HYME|nr:hypothetical protein QAD02_000494 [Eretmocerus hayati]
MSGQKISNQNRDVILDLALIERIQQHPLLYDKSTEQHHKEYRDERPRLLKEIAKDLSEIHEVHLDAIDEYKPSGSEAKVKVSSWVLYADMVWLNEFVDHMPHMSSDSLEDPSASQTYKHPYKKKASSRRDDEQVKSLEELVEQNSAMIEEIGKKLDDTDDDYVNSYFPLVEMRHKKLPEEKKYQCTKEVLGYIQYFKDKKKTTDKEIAVKIITEIQKHPCLFDKTADGYRSEVTKGTAYKTIVTNVNNDLVLKQLLTALEIKNKWRNYIKTYRLNLEKNSKYYLADYMEFLQPHLGLQSQKCENEDDHNTTEKHDDCNSDEKGDEPETSQSNDICTVAPTGNNDGTVNQGNKRKLEESENAHYAQATTSKSRGPKSELITPPPSAKYLRDKGKIADLEESTMELAAEAMKMMKNLGSEDKKEDKDTYLPAIKRALIDVPKEYFLEDINSVLVVIDACLEDAPVS